jgi:hypothetical protein
MMQAFLYMVGGLGLLLGIAVAATHREAPVLFVGLTVVICSVVVFSAAAVIGAVQSLRNPPAR